MLQCFRIASNNALAFGPWLVMYNRVSHDSTPAMMRPQVSMTSVRRSFHRERCGWSVGISMTRAKADELLTVLDQPNVPLHNNDSELGARVSARH
jgi:hypothetical protein